MPKQEARVRPAGQMSKIHVPYKSINKGSQGRKNLKIMEVWGFGPSHNKIENLLDQKLIRIIPRSFSTYHFNIFLQNDPTNCKKSFKLFPMIFLWSPMIFALIYFLYLTRVRPEFATHPSTRPDFNARLRTSSRVRTGTRVRDLRMILLQPYTYFPLRSLGKPKEAIWRFFVIFWNRI